MHQQVYNTASLQYSKRSARGQQEVSKRYSKFIRYSLIVLLNNTRSTRRRHNNSVVMPYLLFFVFFILRNYNRILRVSSLYPDIGRAGGRRNTPSALFVRNIQSFKSKFSFGTPWQSGWGAPADYHQLNNIS